MTSDNILKSIIDYYMKYLDKNTPQSLHIVEKLIDALPPLNKLKIILESEEICRKELLPFKFILDIYEHYLLKFDVPYYNSVLYEYIPLAMQFYSSYSNEDFLNLQQAFTSSLHKDLYSTMSIRMKNVFYKKGSLYIKRLNEIKNNLTNLIVGLDSSKFCK